MMSRSEKGTGSLYQAKDKTWVYHFSEEGKLYSRAHIKPTNVEKYMNTITADELGEPLNKLKCRDWRADFLSGEDEKMQEYFVYFKFFR